MTKADGECEGLRCHVHQPVIAAAESIVEFKKNDQGDFKFKGKKGSSGSSGEDNKPKEGSKS
ncbi:unnamed protein product [Prunus armeniaca]